MTWLRNCWYQAGWSDDIALGASLTHYFYCNVRRFLLEDRSFDEGFRALVDRAFGQEDKPMLEAQQSRMGTDDLWSLKPLLLSIDNAAVLARRRLQALIQAEQDTAAESQRYRTAR